MWLAVIAVLVVLVLGFYYYWKNSIQYSGEQVNVPASSAEAEETQAVTSLEGELQGISIEGLDAELGDIDKELLR